MQQILSGCLLLHAEKWAAEVCYKCRHTHPDPLLCRHGIHALEKTCNGLFLSNVPCYASCLTSRQAGHCSTEAPMCSRRCNCAVVLACRGSARKCTPALQCNQLHCCVFCCDVLTKEAQGDACEFLCVFALQAAAMAVDAHAVPVASDDVDGVQWVEVLKLRQLESKFAPHM